MKRDEYREITGSGYITLKDSFFNCDVEWLCREIAYKCNEDQKLNLENEVIVITDYIFDGNSFTLCIEGIFDTDSQTLESIEYIMLVDHENEFHLNENITNDELIKNVNNKLETFK